MAYTRVPACLWRTSMWMLDLVSFVCWSHKLIALFNQPPMRFSFVKCAVALTATTTQAAVCADCSRPKTAAVAVKPPVMEAHIFHVPVLSSSAFIEIGYDNAWNERTTNWKFTFNGEHMLARLLIKISTYRSILIRQHNAHEVFHFCSFRGFFFIHFSFTTSRNSSMHTSSSIIEEFRSGFENSYLFASEPI